MLTFKDKLLLVLICHYVFCAFHSYHVYDVFINILPFVPQASDIFVSVRELGGQHAFYMRV